MKVPGLRWQSSAKNRSTPESLAKYAPFFQMIQQDAQYSKGVVLNQHVNPVTGVADLVTVTFDMRALQLEQMNQGNIANAMVQAQQNLTPQEPIAVTQG